MGGAVAERRESIARLSLVDPFLPCPVQDRLSTSQSERGYELKSGTTRGSLGSSVRSVLTRHSTESKNLSMNLKCHAKQACRSSWWHLSRSLPVNSVDFWPASLSVHVPSESLWRSKGRGHVPGTLWKMHSTCGGV